MVMNKTKTIIYKKGGYSDIRLRLFILIFMITGLLLTPILGIFASYSVVFLFGIIIAMRTAKFQSTDSRSIWLYRQAMDKMYHNSQNAVFIARRLEDLDKKDARIKAEKEYHKKNSKAKATLNISVCT